MLCARHAQHEHDEPPGLAGPVALRADRLALICAEPRGDLAFVIRAPFAQADLGQRRRAYPPVTVTCAQPLARWPLVAAAVITFSPEPIGMVAVKLPSGPAVVVATEVGLVADPG